MCSSSSLRDRRRLAVENLGEKIADVPGEEQRSEEEGDEAGGRFHSLFRGGVPSHLDGLVRRGDLDEDLVGADLGGANRDRAFIENCGQTRWL